MVKFRSGFVSNSSSSSFVIIGTNFRDEMYDILKTYFDEEAIVYAEDTYDEILHKAEYLLNGIS